MSREQVLSGPFHLPRIATQGPKNEDEEAPNDPPSEKRSHRCTPLLVQPSQRGQLSQAGSPLPAVAPSLWERNGAGRELSVSGTHVRCEGPAQRVPVQAVGERTVSFALPQAKGGGRAPRAPPVSTWGAIRK